MNGVGLVIGLGFGFGLCLVLSTFLRPEIPMSMRIGPYLGDVPQQVQWQRNYFLLIQRINRRDKALWGNEERIKRLLANSGSAMSVQDVRWSQLIWSATSALGMLVWIGVTQFTGAPILGSRAWVLVAASIIGGGWLRLWRLNQEALQRIGQIEEQLPAVLDLLAFAVSSGEAIVPACQRVSTLVGGAIGDEIELLLNRVRQGELFADALGVLQSHTLSQPLQRAARALRLALERGTPVAAVLRSQADDARASRAQSMLALAAKKETLMMMPVVFIILPIIVLVALYPGLRALQIF